jgi:hypothetical protein
MNIPHYDTIETGEMVDADDDEYSEDELELYFPTMEIFVDELGKEVVRNATWLSGAYRRNVDSGVRARRAQRCSWWPP